MVFDPTTASRPNRDALAFVEQALRDHNCEPKRKVKGSWHCPAHDDKRPSLYCRRDNKNKNKVFLECFTGCEQSAVLAKLNLVKDDLLDELPQLSRDPELVIEYPYYDRSGELLSSKRRFEPKDFRWTKGNPHVLYNLPELVDAEHVHINEGEKAADKLAEVLETGHVATCSPTPFWDESFTGCLIGKSVTLWVDRDASGLKRAANVYPRLVTAGIPVKVVQSMTSAEKSDAFDHIEAGFSIEQAVEIAPEKLSDADGVYRAEDKPDAERFPVMWANELEYRIHSRGLIKGVIDRGAFVVMYGDSNSSKTFLGVDMGLCVASGRPWHGKKTRKGLVVYVASEGGRSIVNRVRAHRERFLKDERDVPFAVVPVPVNLLDQDGNVEPLIALIRRLEEQTGLPCELVVIDTLAESMPGGDESGSKDMGTAVAAVQQIRRELECSVILIHHCGKDAARGARGWSGLRAATDTEIEVSNMGDLYFQAKPTKQRDYAMGEPFSYRLDVIEIGEDEDGDIVTTCVVVPVDAGVIPEQKPKGKLNDRCRIFEGCIEGLMKTRGRPIPDDVTETSAGEVSPGQFGVSIEDVRELFYARIEERDDERDSKRDNYRQYFRRTKEKLQALKRIQVSGDWVWFAKGM